MHKIKTPKIDLKELEKMKKEIFRERLEFIDRYAEWIKKTPNKEWSKQHADFIDSLMLNAKEYSLSSREYLDMKDVGNRVRNLRMAKTK